MAVSIVMKCDKRYCTQKISEGDSFEGWWNVFLNEDTYPLALEITPMVEADFREVVGSHFCCIDHAVHNVTVMMYDVNEKNAAKAKELENSTEEAETVEVLDTLAAKYPVEPAP